MNKDDYAGGRPGGGSPSATPEACDPATGACAPVERIDDAGAAGRPGQGRIEVVYATDPLCSACWVMEPAWRKLLYRYGRDLRVRYLYGGLLPGWEEMARAGASIASPEDVAVHWEEVGRRVAQPISAGVWRRDPVPSSYPASQAAHAVRVLDPLLEPAFLRRLRIALFVEERNVARRGVLLACAGDVGVDPARLAALLDAGVGEEPFRRDLEDARRLGVRVFPTLLFYGPEGRLALAGGRLYGDLEAAISEVGAREGKGATPTVEEALRSYGQGTLAEFAVLTGLTMKETRRRLKGIGARRVGRGDELWAPAATPSRAVHAGAATKGA